MHQAVSVQSVGVQASRLMAL